MLFYNIQKPCQTGFPQPYFFFLLQNFQRDDILVLGGNSPMCVELSPDIEKRVKELNEFLKTPECQRKFDEWLRPVREQSERLELASKVSLEALLGPITL
jgi:hypothetical protein